MPLCDQIDVNGDWSEVLERLYRCFCEIFYADPRLLVNGRLLCCDGRKDEDGKEEGFWHIVSRDDRGTRLFDPSRARCIPWIPSMLDGTAPGLTRWRYIEGSRRVRQYYWLEAEQYVLVLEEGKHVTTLVTAFHVDLSGARRDLERRRSKGQPF